MNRFFTICLLALFGAGGSAPQEKKPPVHQPSNRTAAAEHPRKSAPDDSKEPFIIESYSTIARFENDGTGEQELIVRARAQNDAGAQQLHELVFPCNAANQQVEIRYVRVRRPDGTLTNAAADAAKDTPQVPEPAYANLKVKHVAVPPLAPGDTLEYDVVTKLLTPFARGEFWFTHTFQTGAIVRDERLEISVPAARPVILKSAAAPLETAHASGRTIYRWKHANPSVKSEDSSKSHQPPAPDVQMTSFADWGAVARWYAQIEKPAALPSPEIRAKAGELAAGSSDALAKAQALYDFVAAKVRTVDIPLTRAGWQPHPASEVLANEYGDAADKNILLAALLRAAGIEPSTALVPFTGSLDKTVPSPAQLDHAITAFSAGGGNIWMDSTTEVAPFRMLASPLRGKAALLIASSGLGKLVDTSADPPFASVQRVNIDGTVDGLGKLTARAHYSMRGDTELVLRLAFHRTPQSQWTQLAQTILTLDGLRGEVTAVKPGDPAATRDPFELDLDFKQPAFLDWMSKRQSGPLPLLVIGLPDPPADAAKPVELGSPLDVEVKLALTLPENFSALPPVSSSISRDYADFKSSYRFADHLLTAERSLNFKLRGLPASRADDYKDFARAVTGDENRPVLVTSSSSGEPVIPASATADDLVETGLAAMDARNDASAQPLLARAAEIDPKHKLVWNNLGLADLRTGKLDDAVAAFRKQLELNPADPHANEYLGIALQQQNKGDEAAAAFHRQTEIDPLDASAHIALGGILLAERDFPHAATELDKATVLSPKRADLFVDLGRAYLNAGDQPKALAAFQKALQLSPTAPVWNDIAFDLADAKIELERAAQYAESAIRASAESIGKLDLPHVTQAQLRTVASLAECWDTLGWVYFQKGDLAPAERYIRSAWTLDQDGEIGDHLAQVYEKRGEKDRAIRMYALALAAPHSIPDTRARLTLLLGSNSGIDDLVAKAAPGLAAARTIAAGKLFDGDATADFFVALAPAEKSSRADSVRFISGSEDLRPAAEKLRLLDYGEMFPNASPVKIIRRATLGCSKSGCSLVLIPAEEARAN